MFNFFNTFRSESYLGVDIGTTSIKIVEIAKGKMKPELQNYGILESYGHLERVNDAIQTSSLKITENETSNLLKVLLEQSKFKTSEAIVSIPSFAAFISLLEVPQMSDTEISNTMKYQLGQYIPIPATEVMIDWLKVGERQDDQGFIKEEILLISIPKETINKYRMIFKRANLNLVAVEIESLGLIRSADLQSDAPTLIVDIGARSTNIVAVDHKAIKYNFQTDFAAANLTQVLASGLGVNIKRAEKLKKEKGLLSTEGSDLSTLMIPFLDAILNEVKRVQTKYEQSFGNKIEQIILSGGGAKLLGIEKYCESQFNIPTAVSNPFSKVSYSPAMEPVVRSLGSSFAVSIGLGIREFVNNS